MNYRTAFVLGVTALATFATADIPAHAKDAPRAWEASPDIYKIIGKNAKYVIVLATWKPGQIDKPHSHKPRTFVSLTDCVQRDYQTGAAPTDRPPSKAGETRSLQATASHRNENIGGAVCQVLLIEER